MKKPSSDLFTLSKPRRVFPINNPIPPLWNKYRSELWRVGKFSIVGSLNAGVDFALFSLLYLVGGVHYLVAQVFSYGAATINSYLWNRYWTFQSRNKPHGAEFAKFVTVNLISLAASLALLSLFHEIFGFGALSSKIVATVFAGLINFSGNRFWVFRSVS